MCPCKTERKTVMYYLAWCRRQFDIVLMRRNHRLSEHLDTHIRTLTPCSFPAWSVLKSFFPLLFLFLLRLLSHLVRFHPLSPILIPLLTSKDRVVSHGGIKSRLFCTLNLILLTKIFYRSLLVSLFFYTMGTLLCYCVK